MVPSTTSLADQDVARSLEQSFGNRLNPVGILGTIDSSTGRVQDERYVREKRICILSRNEDISLKRAEGLVKLK